MKSFGGLPQCDLDNFYSKKFPIFFYFTDFSELLNDFWHLKGIAGLPNVIKTTFNQKKKFPIIPRFRRFSRVFGSFFRRIALSRPSSQQPPKPPIPHWSPIVVFYKKSERKFEKIGFPIPTATNRFQIRNLRPKKDRMNK